MDTSLDKPSSSGSDSYGFKRDFEDITCNICRDFIARTGIGDVDEERGNSHGERVEWSALRDAVAHSAVREGLHSRREARGKDVHRPTDSRHLPPFVTAASFRAHRSTHLELCLKSFKNFVVTSPRRNTSEDTTARKNCTLVGGP